MSGEPAEDVSQLLDRAREGDLEAFNALVIAYQDRVYGLCLRMLGSPHAAEDATQEAFISAFKNVGGLRGHNVRSWLFRIASNACIDELRRRRRRPSVSLDAPSDEDEAAQPIDLPDEQPGPETQVMRGEQRHALETELLGLPDDQRLAVVLCDVQGLQYEEIAQIMRVSVGTVKSRISRGRGRLREAIRQKPELFDVQRRPTTKGGKPGMKGKQT